MKRQQSSYFTAGQQDSDCPQEIENDSEYGDCYQIPAEVEFDRREAKIGSDFAGNLEPETKELTVFSPFEVAPADFKNSLDIRAENRSTLIRWIRSNLIDGIDKGHIHVVGKDKCKLGHNCKNPNHYSKQVLFKPGAEKICGLVGLRAEYPAIVEYEKCAIEGRKIDVVILRCLLYSGDRVVAEGTGSHIVSKDYGDINRSIKMAEKSGQIDAIMRCAGLSEIFSQEDIVEKIEVEEAAAAKVEKKADITALQTLKDKLQSAKSLPHLQKIWEKYSPEIKMLSKAERESLIALKDVLKASLVAKMQRDKQPKQPSEPERITQEQINRIREIIKHEGTGADVLSEVEREELCSFGNDPFSLKAEAELYIARITSMIKKRESEESPEDD